MSGEPGRRIVVGITGASGALYAVRTVAALLSRDCQVELVVSDFGRRLLRDELGETAAIDGLLEYLVTRYGDSVRAGTLTVHRNRDVGASIASGSYACEAMVIVPCSMKTLAGAAIGGARKTYKHTDQNAPLRANATLEAVGGTAVYLASRAGDYTIGETLTVDGGIVNAHLPTHFADPSGGR